MFKRRTSFKFKRPIILYPVLLIVLFILSRLRIPEVNPVWWDMLIFLTLNLAGLILVFLLLFFFIRDRLKVWILASFILSIVFFYYDLRHLISNIHFVNTILKPPTNSEEYILNLLTLTLFAVVGILILIYKGSLLKISQYLNILMSFLICYQIYAICEQNTQIISLENDYKVFNDSLKKPSERLPNIYYLILDAYTSSQSLKDYWDFKNDKLTDFLEEKGFFISPLSKTNYNQTTYSLASSLNISYLKNIPHSPASIAQEKNLFNLVNSSYVVNVLLKNDYQVVNYSFFDLPFNPKSYNDYFFLIKKNLFTGTLYEPILKKLNINWGKDSTAGLLSLSGINLNILDKLKDNNSGLKKPFFVYAHLMMPHEPYLFDEHGIIQETDSALNYFSKGRYLEQLKFLNVLVENMVSKIFENNIDRLPVVIIQGDHGWRYLNGENRIKESASILNALFLPDRDYRDFYDSISPVNTFRVLFNKYFGFNFKILKDTTYNVFIF